MLVIAVKTFDAAFGHEFINVAVGQPVSEVPTDSQHDDFSVHFWSYRRFRLTDVSCPYGN